MKLMIVRSAAAAEIEEAFGWYESQRLGLGAEFREELRATFARISQNPLAYQVLYRKTRRAFLRSFPYGVFYRIYDEAIVIASVMHGRRHPRHWR